MTHAVVYTAKGALEWGELPRPEPKTGEVLIRVEASGIGHTDIDVLHGRYGPDSYPLVPGHEFAGEVVVLRQGVDGLSVGDCIVVDPNLHCVECRACRKGLHNMCEKRGA